MSVKSEACSRFMREACCRFMREACCRFMREACCGGRILPRLKVGIAAGEGGISRLSALTRRCHPGLNFHVKSENR